MEKQLTAMTEEDEDGNMEFVDNLTSHLASADNEFPDVGGMDGVTDEPATNMFESLCGGLTTSLHMIRTSVNELQGLKDELLKHSLPPELLVKLVICTSKIFRSVSDCQVPAGELIRLVNLYSGDWDEKSSALSKLHESYASKRIQLDIALRKLTLNNGKVHRVEQQRRLMNWEKLYLRTLVAKQLGDTYEDATAPLREASADGTEALRKLVFQMNDLPAARELVRKKREERLSVQQKEQDWQEFQDCGTEEDERPVAEDGKSSARQQTGASGDNATTGRQSTTAGDFNVLTLDNLTTHDSQSRPAGSDVDNYTVDDPNEVNSSRAESSNSRQSLQRNDTPGRGRQLKIQPQVCDANVSTSDAEYDVYLYARVFAPEGLHGNLPVKCIASIGDQRVSTTRLFGNVEDPPVPASVTSVETTQFAAMRPGRRGLIGSQTSSTGNIGSLPSATEDGADKSGSRHSTPPVKDPSKPRYDDCVFRLSEEMLADRMSLSNHFTFALYGSLDNQQLGVATVDMDDLRSLDLMSLFLPPPDGTVDEVERAGSVASSVGNGASPSITSVGKTPSPTVGTRVKHAFDNCPASMNALAESVDGIRSTGFPLYPPAGVVGTMRSSVKLPISLCWVKRVRPRTLDRVTQSETLNDIILDITGSDMNSFSKEVARPDTYDRSVSAMSAAINEYGEFIPRVEYMKVLRTHEDEFQMMKAEYEVRLQDLTEALQMMHESHDGEQHRARRAEVGHVSRSHGGRSRSPTSPGIDGRRPRPSQKSRSPGARARTCLDPINEPASPIERPSRTVPARNTDSPETTSNWGDDIPHNFYDRLRHFEDRVRQRRQELCSRNRGQTSEAIEKRLADQRKLSRQPLTDLQLSDDVSLPAVFMPTKTRDLNIYNSRAHQYFHATGAGKLRLTQPPSMLQLPPIAQTNLSVVNLFDITRNFQRNNTAASGGSTADWLIGQYVNQQMKSTSTPTNGDAATASATGLDREEVLRPESSREAELLQGMS